MIEGVRVAGPNSSPQPPPASTLLELNRSDAAPRSIAVLGRPCSVEESCEPAPLLPARAGLSSDMHSDRQPRPSGRCIESIGRGASGYSISSYHSR